MKRQLLTILFTGASLSLFAQTQIGNSNFEQWETVASGEEPLNWSSFLSASGSLSGAASDQCESSTDVRPGSSGTKSVRIFSFDIFGTIANGNVTVGRINMGSVTPTSPNNYNSSIVADVNFSEALTDQPDSVVFWAKFTPNSGNTTDSARVSAIIHDNYAFRDPIDANSAPHTVATAMKNFAKTDGNWVRMSVPFDYAGPSSTPEFILITFATSYIPGGGEGNDQLWVDDVELIYNPASVSENAVSPVQVINQNGHLSFVSVNNVVADVNIYNTAGQVVASGTSTETFDLNVKGLFIVKMATANGVFSQQVIVQ